VKEKTEQSKESALSFLSDSLSFEFVELLPKALSVGHISKSVLTDKTKEYESRKTAAEGEKSLR
jgi:hypothetical protein